MEEDSDNSLYRRRGPDHHRKRTVDSFIYKECRIHFSCSGTEKDLGSVEQILNHIGQFQYCTGSIQDYRRTITSKDQCVRETIENCDMVIGIVTSGFITDKMCLYEIALSIQFEKRSLLILFERVEIPEIFGNLEMIDATGLAEFWKDILKKRISDHKKGSVSGGSIENYVSELQNKLFPPEIREQHLKEELKRKDDTIRKKDDEIQKLRAMLQNQKEEKYRRQSTKHQRNSQEIDYVVTALCEATETQRKSTVKKNREESIREISKKYSSMFSMGNIRVFGRNLQLDEDDFEAIYQYRENGCSELFWQTVRVWMSKKSHKGKDEIRTLLRAIKESGVDLEGREMPEKEKKFLQSKATVIIEEIHSVKILMPHLIARGLVCDATKHYIMAVQTLDQQVLRLIEILETKEHGLSLFTDCLTDTDQLSLAEKLKEYSEYNDEVSVTRRKTPGRKRPVQKVLPSVRSSDSAASTSSNSNDSFSLNSLSPYSSFMDLQQDHAPARRLSEDIGCDGIATLMDSATSLVTKL